MIALTSWADVGMVLAGSACVVAGTLLGGYIGRTWRK